MGINSLEEVYKNFLDFNVISISPIEAGHINDTYLVKTKENMFILQRIQKAIDILKLEYNYELYSKAFNEVGFLYLQLTLKTGDMIPIFSHSSYLRPIESKKSTRASSIILI